jgi:hypothetical protein
LVGFLGRFSRLNGSRLNVYGRLDDLVGRLDASKRPLFAV